MMYKEVKAWTNLIEKQFPKNGIWVTNPIPTGTLNFQVTSFANDDDSSKSSD